MPGSEKLRSRSISKAPLNAPSLTDLLARDRNPPLPCSASKVPAPLVLLFLPLGTMANPGLTGESPIRKPAPSVETVVFQGGENPLAGSVPSRRCNDNEDR